MSNDITIIAEIGINHNGDVNLAKKLMDMCKTCNVDLVKFQKRDIKITTPKDMYNIKKDTKWGYINYIDYKKKLELDKKDYDEINEYSEAIGLDWFASAWDKNSLDFLNNYNLKYNKIPSALLTNEELLKYVASNKKKTFISTGMSTLKDIDNAVEIFKSYNCPFVIMHCVGIYPCPDEFLNLKFIETIKNRYDCEVGYSGHAPGILDSTLAVMMGAKYIEKHVTLDSSMYGSDQASSLEKRGLEYTVRDTNRVSKMLGSGKKVLLEEEKIKLQTLKYW